MSTLDPRALRSAFGTFMTGVTVVTTTNADGAPIGFTANSFSSVSLDPALLSVCIAKSSSNFDAFCTAPNFAVNILSEHQIEVSNTFARPVEDRFAAIVWRPGSTGAPILDGVTGWFDCTQHACVDAGDHVVLIGEITAFDSTETPGLGYVRGAYVTPSRTTDALSGASQLVVSALIMRDGDVLLTKSGSGWTLPSQKVGENGASETLSSLLASTGLSAQPGFVYSVFDDGARAQQHISFLCNAGDGQPATGQFVALSEIDGVGISDEAILTMLQRLARESENQAFGLYVGDHATGQVRPIGKGR